MTRAHSLYEKKLTSPDDLSLFNNVVRKMFPPSITHRCFWVERMTEAFSAKCQALPERHRFRLSAVVISMVPICLDRDRSVLPSWNDARNSLGR